MRQLLVVAAMAALTPGAFAQGKSIEALHKLPCATGVIDREAARIALIKSAFPAVPDELLPGLATSTLGNVARDRASKQDALTTLYNDLNDAFDAAAGGEPDSRTPVTIAVDRKQAKPDPEFWASRFLNGDHAWATFKCFRKDPSPAKPPTPVATDDPKPGIVVAETLGDLEKGLKDRKYAKFGLESDAGDTTLSANLVVGMASTPLWGISDVSEGSWSPFVEYNRKTSDDPAKDVNSLMFGAGFNYPLGPKGFRLLMDTDVAWQTDDDFDASLWRLQHAVDIPLTGWCVRTNQGGLFWDCAISVVADYVRVDDPGSNPKWAQQKDFTRAGLDFEWYVGHDFGKARLSLLAAYSSRFDIAGEDTTAEMKSLKLSYEPDKEGQFSLSATYKRGKDIKTIADVDTFSLELGYRQ